MNGRTATKVTIGESDRTASTQEQEEQESVAGEPRAPPKHKLEVGIPAVNLKSFALVIQFLCRVGKELLIEGRADGLVLRTLSDSKSAYAAVTFSQDFFDFYTCQAKAADPADEDGAASTSVTCKILLKAVHNLFRTLKNVHRLLIAVEAEDQWRIEPRLKFLMHCEYGIKKEHRLGMQDCEPLYAVFDDDGVSSLRSPPKKLMSLLTPFHGGAEVAACMAPSFLSVRSHVPEGRGASRATMRTEMVISSAEFDSYIFQSQATGEEEEEERTPTGGEPEPLEFVFTLKEARAALGLCEALDTSVQMCVRGGGQPIRFSAHTNTIDIELVQATMAVGPTKPVTNRNEAEEEPPKGASKRARNGSRSTEPQVEERQKLSGERTTNPQEQQTARDPWWEVRQDQGLARGPNGGGGGSSSNGGRGRDREPDDDRYANDHDNNGGADYAPPSPDGGQHSPESSQATYFPSLAQLQANRSAGELLADDKNGRKEAPRDDDDDLHI